MNKTICFVIAVSLMLWSGASVSAQEHGGESAVKEHGGTVEEEHGGTSEEPSADAIRSAMEGYVMDQSMATGTFDVLDPETGTTRKLELVRIHERVGKTGDSYYSCADFKDTETGEMLDLDLDVEDAGGELSVVDVRIHKVDGQERYTYDEQDNRVPVMDEDSYMDEE